MTIWRPTYKAEIDGRTYEVSRVNDVWLGYVTIKGKRVLVTTRNKRDNAMKDCASHRGARLAVVKMDETG